MSWLYAAAQPFVGHAERAFVVAGGWVLLALIARRGARPLLIAAGAWTVFGLLEAEATREHADIRVDLLITWPVLLLCTIACVAWWLRPAPRRPGLEPR
jgi:hypothetical protein